MNQDLERELERLTANAAMRRETLLFNGLAKSRLRKRLNIAAGVMALFSAATLATAASKLLGADGFQFLAAAIALASGTLSLVVTSYFSDDEILGALAGSSKYLALRDAVFRLAINQETSEKLKFRALAELQQQYSDLDAEYSKYFSLDAGYHRRPPVASQRPPVRSVGPAQASAEQAAQADVAELHRKMGASH